MIERINSIGFIGSRDQVEKIIDNFLNNANVKVLAIKGNWGVGKTYLIQNFLSNGKPRENSYYIYASVFGISSIEQLKIRLIGNYNNQLINNNHSIQTKNGKINQLMDCFNRTINKTIPEWLGQIFTKFERIPKLDLALSRESYISVPGMLLNIVGDLILSNLFYINAIKSSVICIDDLERKSNLSLDEVFGFVEYLVQELKCKIILVYNETQLDSDSKEVLEIYREKIIDIEVELKPTIEENITFIFNDDPDLQVIKEIFLKTGTNNIRVLRKAKSFIDMIMPLIDNWESILREQIITNIIITTLIKFDSEFRKKNFLDMEVILSMINSQEYSEKINEKLDAIDQSKRINQLRKLDILGYKHSQLDIEIVRLIETSLFSSSYFTRVGIWINDREKQNQVMKKWRNIIGSPYYNSFANNEQEIKDIINNFLDENILKLGFSDFESIEKFAVLIEMDISDYERIILKDILESSEPSYLINSQVFKTRLLKYPDLESRMIELNHKYYVELSIGKAIKYVINSYSQLELPNLDKDIEFLNSCTVEEYCKWLENGDQDLYSNAKNLLRLGLTCSETLKKAIIKLANNNRINKIRAQYLYDIEVNNLSNPANPD